MSNRAELTLIIPFLNEGNEVYNTVKNFKETADVDIDIILINDASNDGFDYKGVADNFDAIYIEHQTRKGVAASRDEGINICKTPYFLLLDAHMRAFQSNWTSLILNEIKANKRAILCCCTRPLNNDGTIGNEFSGYGSVFNFPDLSIYWALGDKFTKADVFEIPCVLGASYICEKHYWLYLKGLTGLIDYGLDEQLISIKVWLEGGSCKVLSKVVFGHLFRSAEKVPYAMKSVTFLYNQLLIAELFLEQKEKIHFYNKARNYNGYEICKGAMEILFMQKENIISQKQYFKTIFTRDIQYLVELNEKFKE